MAATILKVMRKISGKYHFQNLSYEMINLVEPVKLWNVVGQVVLYYARCRFFPPVFHMYIPWRGAFKNLGLFRLVGRRQATRRDRIKRSENRDMKFWQIKVRWRFCKTRNQKYFLMNDLKVMFTKTLIGFKNILK